MPGPTSLGRELYRLRTASGLTLAELSSRSGVRAAYLAAIENDREEPSAAALRRLVRAFEPADVSYEQLASLLAAPEFDPSGEYTHSGDAKAQSTRRDDDPGSVALPPGVDGTTVERVWRGKTDLQLLVSLKRLAEYNPVGQRAIRAEAERRGLELPRNGPDAPPPHVAAVDEALQFDHAITRAAPSSPTGAVAVTCAVCQAAIDTEYYDVNGTVACGRCRAAAEAVGDTPKGIVPVLVAGAFGLGAAVAGAIIYYAVLAIANVQIGYVAILIGYMVGRAVRKATRGRGGLRFQILAVGLTYASIALAYTPIVVKQAVDARRAAQPARATAGERPVAAPAAAGKPGGGTLFAGLLLFSVFILALPVLVVWGSFPSGLISAFIIFIGLRQSWKMTGAPTIQVLGPYRVGAGAPATSA